MISASRERINKQYSDKNFYSGQQLVKIFENPHVHKHTYKNKHTNTEDTTHEHPHIHTYTQRTRD